MLYLLAFWLCYQVSTSCARKKENRNDGGKQNRDVRNLFSTH
jgi:hypothetical protein